MGEMWEVEDDSDRERGMKLKGSHVTVTGAGGFIGSHLVEALVRIGAQVRAFVHYNSRHDPGMLSFAPQSVRGKLEIRYGDLRDPFAVRNAVEGTTQVFHLGALISIPYSYRNPYDVAQTNLIGTLNVLQACLDVGVDRLVHTSSSEVYGTARQIPMDEDHPLHGQSPYSASKIGADKLAESYFCAYDLPVVMLRPFNTYGPRQSARAIVPTIITQVLSSKTVRLGNLEAKRDLTYVSDVVEGFIRAAEASGIEGKVFNLGTGKEVSIRTLAELIPRLVGKEVEIVVEGMRIRPERSEVRRLLSDNTLAKNLLGWHPQISLEEGLRTTIAWISNHLHLYEAGSYQI